MKAQSRTDSPGVAAPVLLALAVVAAHVPATVAAQNLGDVDARLARVERVLDQSLLEQLQQIDALQREIRQLRGEIEGLNNQIATLERRNQNILADTDARLGELESLVRAGTQASPGEDGDVLDLTADGLDETALLEDGLEEDALGGSAGELVASQGVFVSESQRPNAPVTAIRSNATQAEKAAYTRAYDLLARGRHLSAAAEFDDFLLEYPAGPYSFNAWYWKGEAMYAERRFDEAIANFREVTDQFPTSTKVPDAQLKIGFSLYEQGEFAAARQILESVRDRFEGRSAAVLARKRLQLMDREGR